MTQQQTQTPITDNSNLPKYSPNFSNSKQHRNKIKIMLINARSLINKVDIFKIRVNLDKPDVVGVTETWAHKDISNSELQLDGYNMIRYDRQTGIRGGGVILYIKYGIPFTQLESDQTVESIWCKISSKFKIGLYYCAPNNTSDYIEAMCNEISQNAAGKVVIMGDFNFPNINWNNYTCCRYSEKFRDTCLDYFLHQMVLEKTRVNSTLDLVLTSHENLISNLNVSDPLATCDHNVIEFILNSSLTMNSKKNEQLRLNKANYDGMRSVLKDINWISEFDSCSNAQEAWIFFNSKMQEIINTHIPHTKVRKKKHAHWFSYDIKVKLSQKKAAWKVFKSSNAQQDFELYKYLELDLKHSIKAAKARYEAKISNEVKSNPKTFYSYASKKEATNISSISDQGKILTDDQDIAEALNNFFTSTFTLEDLDSIPQLEALEHAKISDITISHDIVLEKLKHLKESKAPGPDGLYSKILKEVCNEIAEPLAYIFRKSLDEGMVMKDWKIAHVSPLFKKGKRDAVESYRPISLTSIPCKIFESIMKDALVDYLCTHNLISRSQHGFVSGRSCLTNLLEYLEYITEQIDQNNPVDCIFLDFSKAFDKVPHQRLLAKVKSLGIEGKLLGWISDWLKDRQQRVILNGSKSEWQPVLSGVPQGSVLGPLLFIMFVNDLDQVVSSSISKFADDTKVYSSVSTHQDSISLQNDLDRLVEWSNIWQMNFNASKCKVIHFGSSNRKCNYSIAGTVLDHVNVEKDLGVTISDNLKASNHVDEAVLKANRILGMINRNIENKSKYVLLPLYRALVRPHLEFCVQAWNPHLMKDIVKLERVQKRAVRMMKDLGGGSYEDKLKELDLFSLEKRRIRGDMITVFRIVKGFDKVDSSKFFRFRNLTWPNRCHSMQIVKQQFRTDVRKHFFSQRIINFWNRLPASVVDSKSITSFKSNLDRYFEEVEIH